MLETVLDTIGTTFGWLILGLVILWLIVCATFPWWLDR